ncbi:MAG: ubiquinol-cytochrome c reductase iron-sulfur subunit [Caldilineales bacterium]|nr:ubiquinol-cytochrome c reductase iron-sulfur subunit [Caldilineales bacterium]
MADIETKSTAEMTREERIAAAKARAAAKTAAAATETSAKSAEKADESGDAEVSEAAQRFQTRKTSEKAGASRKAREAELMQRAVTVSPRSGIEQLPQAEAPEKDRLAVNRREFLTYAWGGALALIALQGGVATLWFAYPRFKAGEFGGVFTMTSIPAEGAKPDDMLAGKFWWSNAFTGEGMIALYKVCTHLGCLYEWKDQTERFECPCHGSKFNQAGRNIKGPAARDLDQFVVAVEDSTGAVVDVTTELHRYVTAGEGLTYKVDTGRKILGRPSDPSLHVEA